jgi:hypothetical protein
MVVICKFCKGSGQAPQNGWRDFFSVHVEPCPACRGAGELVLPGKVEDYVICKVCKGTGSLTNPFNNFFSTTRATLCSACKGAGSLTRPVLQSNGGVAVTTVYGALPRPKTFDFDVALSFAGEDRKIVESYAQILKTKGLRVFLDSDQQAELWGTDLYVKLDEIYRMRAMFCIMFISKHYAAKYWTNHERQSAQARAFKENREYILPVRLDDTEIPGLRETVGYIDLRKISIEELAKLTLEKVEKEKKRVSSSITN